MNDVQGDLKAARCRQLMESRYVIKLRYFLTLAQGHLNVKIKIIVFSEITGPMKVKFYVKPPCLGGTKFCA